MMTETPEEEVERLKKHMLARQDADLLQRNEAAIKFTGHPLTKEQLTALKEEFLKEIDAIINKYNALIEKQKAAQ